MDNITTDILLDEISDFRSGLPSEMQARFTYLMSQTLANFAALPLPEQNRVLLYLQLRVV